jgi:hypothetical protein
VDCAFFEPSRFAIRRRALQITIKNKGIKRSAGHYARDTPMPKSVFGRKIMLWCTIIQYAQRGDYALAHNNSVCSMRTNLAPIRNL